MNIAQAFRRLPIFAAMEVSHLSAWLRSAQTMRVQLGDTLLQAGTPGRHVYLVEEGEVRVLRYSKSGRETSLGIFQPGDVFGEYALVPPGKNTATCRASKSGCVLRMPLAPLQELLAQTRPLIPPHMKRWLRLHALLLFLRDGPWLGFKSAPSIARLLDRTEAGHFDAGSTIQAEGLADNSWFFVKSGHIRVFPSGNESEDGCPLLGPGDCFGEKSLLHGQGLAVAQAETAVDALALRKEAFYGLQGESPASVCQTVQTHAHVPAATYPWVRQEDANDCGVAALTMIARYHGLAADLQQIRHGAAVTDRGMSLLELSRVAMGLGFRARAVQVAFHQLPTVRLPAIALFEEGHYVVVYALEQAGIIVGDPAQGVVRRTPAIFRESFGGCLLVLKPQGLEESTLLPRRSSTSQSVGVVCKRAPSSNEAVSMWVQRAIEGDRSAQYQLLARHAKRLIEVVQDSLGPECRAEPSASGLERCLRLFFHGTPLAHLLDHQDALWACLAGITICQRWHNAMRALLVSRGPSRKCPILCPEDSAETWQAIAQGPHLEDTSALIALAQSLVERFADQQRQIVFMALQNIEIAKISEQLQFTKRTVSRVLDRLLSRVDRMRKEILAAPHGGPSGQG